MGDATDLMDLYVLFMSKANEGSTHLIATDRN